MLPFLKSVYADSCEANILNRGMSPDMKKTANSFDRDHRFDWPIFPKDETESELRITEVAMREGADGFPESESSVLSTTENEIVGRIRRFYVSVLEVLSNKFIQLGEETANIKIFLERFDLTQIPIQLKGKVEREITDAGVAINSLASQARVAKENLEIFKRVNGLDREPVYSESWRNIWGPFLIVFLFVFEVVLNGALVSGVVEGLIGGVAISITVATINVVLSVIVGKNLFPQLNRVQTLARKLGVTFVCILYGLSIIYLNLVFGVFRSTALELRNVRSWEDVGTAQTVVSALKPWESLPYLTDIPSLFVIGAGITFAIIAALDGYRLDDPYPGFGDVNRKFTEALKPFEEAKTNITNKVLRIIDDSSNLMESRITEFESKLARWGTIENMARQQFSSYVVWISQLELDANKFLNDYRAANIKGRHSVYSTKKSPDYFDSKWTFSEQEKDPSKTFSHLTYLLNHGTEAFENKIIQTQQEMISIRDESYDSLQKFMQEVDDKFEKS